jgi:hypothetical protein
MDIKAFFSPWMYRQDLYRSAVFSDLHNSEGQEEGIRGWRGLVRGEALLFAGAG